MVKPNIVVVGAGINGLVAANYLQRSGCQVHLIERAAKVGGACISATATVGDVSQLYPLGATTLGLMQDFVYEETGLADCLEAYVPEHPKFIHFPGDTNPTLIFSDPAELDAELERKWGEKGDVQAFRDDEASVVKFLQDGYRRAMPPTVEAANSVLGKTLTELWIKGSARGLMDHYFTSERSKIYMAMTVTESGPVSLDDPYSAFTLPLMDSGSIFGGHYGFVKGGIWRITEELARINSELGIKISLSSTLSEVNTKAGSVIYESKYQTQEAPFDYLVMATDPVTACRLVGTRTDIAETKKQRFRGSSGKLTLMFKNPVQWKHGSGASDSDTPFRFMFSVSDIEEYEKATLRVLDDDVAYEPGYLQIYCEGASMRQLGLNEPFDRLTVFFKNLSLSNGGADSEDVREQVREQLFQYIQNPADCVWDRLLTPKDLKDIFLFPGGNIDHTVLTGGQTYFDRNYSNQPATNFYRFGDLENVYMCGSGTYPCGSVTGTPGYMCSKELMQGLDGLS